MNTILCERCETTLRIDGERYCKVCKKVVLAELRSTGYLTRAPRFAGEWSGCGRSAEQQENVRETKHGVDR